MTTNNDKKKRQQAANEAIRIGDFYYAERPAMPTQPERQATGQKIAQNNQLYRWGDDVGTAKSSDTNPNIVDRAISETDKVYGRFNNSKSPQMISDLFLRNNPKPELPKDDIETQRKRANYALAAEVLRLISDTAAGVYGGNIYKRHPLALRQVEQSNSNEDRLRATYEANMRNWQNAYANALKGGGENKDDYASIFSKIYGGYLDDNKQGNINQRFYDNLDWKNYDREDDQEHELMLQRLKGTLQEKLAQLQHYYGMRAKRADSDELVLESTPSGQTFYIRKSDREGYRRGLDFIAAQNGGAVENKVDRRSGKVISPTPSQVDAAKSTALTTGVGAVSSEKLTDDYSAKSRKKTVRHNTQINNTNTNNKWQITSPKQR